MWRKLFLIPLLLLIPALAHANQRYTGYCSRGGQNLIVSGITGSILNPYTSLAGGNYINGSYPFCTITVYNTGTTTLASGLSTDAAGLQTLPSIFTADQYGVFYFYAPNFSRLDINLSGANIPSWTIGDVYFCDATCITGGGGGGGTGTLINFAAGNLAPLFTTSVSSPALSPVLSFALSAAPPNTVFGNPTGAAAAPIYYTFSLSTIPGSIACSQLPALTGDVTMPVGTCVTTIALQDKKRVCMIDVGSDDGPLLVSTNLGPQLEQCQVGENATVYELDVASNAGQPSVVISKRHCTVAPCVPGPNETVSNLMSSPFITPGTSGSTACANTTGAVGLDGLTTCIATLQNSALMPGDWLELTSGTADGIARRLSIAIHFTVN